MTNPTSRAALSSALSYRKRDLAYSLDRLDEYKVAVTDETENAARLANEVRDLEAALA